MNRINDFIEQTAEQNHNRDVEQAARERARESRLMKQYGVEIEVPDNATHSARKRAAKSKDKVVDQSWLTKDYMKKKWEEIKKQAAEKEAAQKKQEAKEREEVKEAMKQAALKQKSSALNAVDQKVSSALSAPVKPKEESKEKKEPVVVRTTERIPKSKAKILSKQIENNQKMAFHNSFASELGLSSNMTISKLLGKGPKR